MIEISICMIVKNEEECLARCLESIKDIADEIVIVDTGSVDKTKDIAKNYTEKIYDFEWIDDFSAARNYSFSKATKDYVMWLDADDVIEEIDRKKLLNLKKTLDKSIDLVVMKYNSGVDEQGKPILSYYRERILKRDKGYVWQDPVHEVIQISGNYIHEDIAITHKKAHKSDPERNLKIYRKVIEEGKKLSPRQQFYYSRELYYNKEYKEAVKGFEELLNSGEAWYENSISACKDMALCYYELGEREKALNSLFRSFQYDLPRAEFACDIAKYFEDIRKYNLAIYWYNIALTSKIDETTGGFYNKDYYDYVPYLGLCVCYYNLRRCKKIN